MRRYWSQPWKTSRQRLFAKEIYQSFEVDNVYIIRWLMPIQWPVPDYSSLAG